MCRGQTLRLLGRVMLMHPGSVGFFHQTLKYKFCILRSLIEIHIMQSSPTLELTVTHTHMFRPHPGTTEKL